VTEERIHIPLQAFCDQLKPISLGEMKSVRLMNRIDTKYLAPICLLPELLEFAASDFRIQQVNGHTISKYSTQYYDTQNLEMYTLHHNGKLPRQKVRLRTYVDSNLHFLEIKKKSNKGRTDKIRVELTDTPDFCGILGTEWHEFIVRNSPYDECGLLPHINTSFERITLVNNNLSERITIDTNLQFLNCRNGKQSNIPELMIIELKQDGRVHSKMKDFLFDRRILPKGISKYCLGTVMTDPTAKSNRFRVKVRYINKLINTNK
jgi:VTC domain